LLRVQDDRRQAGGPEVRELIVLERDQGRDDDGRPCSHQPGELVDRRLAPASRQDRQHVASLDRSRDGA
jgi:hypothetical protein